MKWLIIPERRVKRCDEVAAFFLAGLSVKHPVGMR